MDTCGGFSNVVMTLGITSSASILGGGSTSFTVDAVDEGNQASLGSFFIKAEGAGSLSIADITTVQKHYASLPSGRQSGDIAIIFNSAFNNSSTDIPTTVVPSGFTQVAVTDIDAGNEFKTVVSFKVLDGTENSTQNTMNAEHEANITYLIRPSSTITSTTVGSVNTFEGNTNPPAQTVDLSSVGNHPVIVGAFRDVRSASPVSDMASLTGSDGFTFEQTSENQTDTNSRQLSRAAIYINDNGVYNELVNTNCKDIVLYASFDEAQGNYNSITQRTFLSPPNSTKFTISDNTFQGQVASTSGVGNGGSASTIPNYRSMSTLPDGTPKLFNYNRTLDVENACIVEPNIGAGTWHDYLTGAYFNTLSVEFYFYIGSNSNTGSSFPRIFNWGDPNCLDSPPSDTNGFALEFSGSQDRQFDAYVYVDDDNSNRIQIIDQNSNVSANNWYYVYMGVDRANGTCGGVLTGYNRNSVTFVTPTGSSSIPTNWTPKDFPIKLGQHNSARGYDGGICDLVVRINDPNYSFKLNQNSLRSSGQTNLKSFLGNLTS